MKCFAAMAVIIVSVSAAAQDEFAFSWTRKPVDGRMTGVVSAGPDNVAEAMGYIDRGRYHSPSGRV